MSRSKAREDASPEESLLAQLREFFTSGRWWEVLWDGLRVSLIEFARQNASVLVLAAYSLAKATGVTVKSGNTGLLFSFGRASKEVAPGFRFLIPFLQIVRIVPTRQRTLDLPAQRVTTFDGLVYLVDANIVYQVTDVRKALIEVDDLVKGMRQVLVLSVQEVLRASNRETLQMRAETDQRLADAMTARLEPWGVTLLRAGLTSITPSPTTLKLVQLDVRVKARQQGLERLESQLEQPLALALLGTAQRFSTRSRLLREREIRRRRHRRVRRVLRTEIQRSGLKLSPKERSRMFHQTRTLAGLEGVLGDSGPQVAPKKKSVKATA